MNRIWIGLFSIVLVGCQPSDEPAESAAAPEVPIMEQDRQAESEPDATTHSATDRLSQALASQSSEIQARYDQRHPQETLEFFGVEPGMTVVEGLPGGGWYTKILLPYLGSEGRLIGANYPMSLFQQFDFATEDFLVGIAGWPDTFPAQAAEWCAEDCAELDAFWLGNLPDELHASADAVLFIRALHNMARFQNQGVDDYLDQAFRDAYQVLKPGGVLGVVQHQAREDMPDDWATGGTGYLKKSFVIAQAEAAGFVLEAESAINENPADQPTVSDVVWRLPPSLSTSGEDPELRAQLEAIGESHRMTLKFRKPASEGTVHH